MTNVGRWGPPDTVVSMNLLDLLSAAAQNPLDQATLAELNESITGLDQALGIRYTHVAAGLVRTVLHVNAQHLQVAGLVNGGVYASIAESTGSVAGMVAAQKPVVGVNNSTDFISSVRAGVIEAEATPIQVGRRTQLWQIEIRHREKLVARSTLRTMVMD